MNYAFLDVGAGDTPLSEGLDAFFFSGPGFLGLRASLLPLRWLFAICLSY